MMMGWPRVTVEVLRVLVLLACSGMLLGGCDLRSRNGRGSDYANGGTYTGSDPSFSADGSKVVFGSIRNGRGDIYVVNSDGSELKRLTFTEDYEGQPQFSPDGRRIVFVSERDGRGNGEIYIMNADGSRQERLTDSSDYNSEPTFSPDGAKIAFIRQFGKFEKGLFIMNADGSGLRQLTQDSADVSSPQFSRDGRKIRYKVFDVREDRARLMEISLDGFFARKLLDLSRDDFDIFISHDESKVAFASTRVMEGGWERFIHSEIFLVDFDGGNLRQVTNRGALNSHPEISRDGRKIVFLAQHPDRQGRGDVCIMNADGANVKVLATNY
jgi:TolB protein